MPLERTIVVIGDPTEGHTPFDWVVEESEACLLRSTPKASDRGWT